MKCDLGVSELVETSASRMRWEHRGRQSGLVELMPLNIDSFQMVRDGKLTDLRVVNT